MNTTEVDRLNREADEKNKKYGPKDVFIERNSDDEVLWGGTTKNQYKVKSMRGRYTWQQTDVDDYYIYMKHKLIAQFDNVIALKRYVKENNLKVHENYGCQSPYIYVVVIQDGNTITAKHYTVIAEDAKHAYYTGRKRYDGTLRQNGKIILKRHIIDYSEIKFSG